MADIHVQNQGQKSMCMSNRSMSSPILSAMRAMITHELKLYGNRLGESVRPVIFFVMVVSLFPMALRLSPEKLGEIAPSIIWLAAVLAILVSLETVLKSDFEDGTLEQLLLSPHSLALLLLSKLFAHWIAIAFPILLVAPLLAISLNLPEIGYTGLLATLLIGLPTLSLVAAMSAALVVGLREGGLFLALLALPLMLPVLLLGVSGTFAASLGLPFIAELALMGALFLFLLILTPITMAYALRVSVQ